MPVRNVRVSSAEEEEVDSPDLRDEPTKKEPNYERPNKTSSITRDGMNNSTRQRNGSTKTSQNGMKGKDVGKAERLGGSVKKADDIQLTDIDDGEFHRVKDKDAENHHERERHSRRRRCLHILLFGFLFANDLADFVSDWLFFVDVVIAESGLVYGPPEPAAVWCLLFFSIVGTVTFFIECVNLWWEYFRQDPWIDSDILSAVVIWIEDVPQVAISLYLALCREEPISIFQLTKAAVIICSVVIRIIITSVKYCNKNAIKQHHHVKTKALIMLGVILEAFAAGAIFFFTQTERTGTGDVSFRVPTTVIEETFNDQRYFANVSAFLSLPLVFGQGMLDTDKTDSIGNWLRVTSLNHIRASDDGETTFRVQYEQANANLLKLAIHEKEGSSSNNSNQWTLAECYEVNPTTGQITDQTNTTCAVPGYFTNSTSLFTKFHYQSPGFVFKKKVFGDITLNMRQEQSGKCTPVDKFTNNIEDSVKNNIPYVIRYYRTNETITPVGTGHLLHVGTGNSRFFRNENPDLIEIYTVWKTGWLECDSTGRAEPELDKGLAISCN